MDYEEFKEKFGKELGIDHLEHLYAYILNLKGFDWGWEESDWRETIDGLDLSEIDSIFPMIDICYILDEWEKSDYIEGYKESMEEEISHMLKHDGYEYLTDYIDFEAYFDKLDLDDVFGNGIEDIKANGKWYYIIET